MLMVHIKCFETVAVGVKDSVPDSVKFSCGSKLSRGSVYTEKAKDAAIGVGRIKYGRIRLREVGSKSQIR
ncbi:unnamed protein product [Arabidopsis halleri]